jgi:hypothetical protein
MRPILRTPAFIAWLTLVVATSTSAWLGDGHGPREVAAIVVIVIAFAKIRLVGRYFMELRAAPVVLRAVFDAWVCLVGCALIAMYVLGV